MIHCRNLSITMFIVSVVTLLTILMLPANAQGEDYKIHSFKKITLTQKFFAEGASAGDFNKDEKMDVVVGPNVYYGPDFQSKQSYRKVTEFKPTGYSDNFLTHVYDFNGDGYDDILVIGWPGYKKDHEHKWYENPGAKKVAGKQGPWIGHLAYKTVDNESPGLGDVDGDGKPELVFHTQGKLGYAKPDWANPTKEWTFHPISTKGKRQRYTHGIGYGDVNGDGRMDFLETDGWWEQPASLKGDPVWKRHIWRFGQGGAQMYAYDVDGDGDNDVITSIRAHGYGLAWFEHYKDAGQIKFKEHRIIDDKPEKNRYGVKFSQMHALDLVDIDGDGVKDIVTGKRWWAHGPKGDAEPNAAAVVYWFKTVRDASKKSGSATFIPYQVDNNSGVGTQVKAVDLNGDGYPEIVVGNKKGGFVHMHVVKKASKAQWQAAQPKIK
jgi:hypothetical protein